MIRKQVVLLLASLFLLFDWGAADEIKNAAPFKLLATLFDSHSSGSSCTILDLTTGKQKNYKMGDKVDGYQVAMITRASVTLLKNGEYLFLNLPLGNENKPVTYDGFPAIKVKRSLLETNAANLNFLLNQILPVPYVESGKITGLLIPPIRSKTTQLLLNATGLKEGDVATAVNGETISSLKRAVELYNKYKDQPRIELEIKRGKTTSGMTYLVN